MSLFGRMITVIFFSAALFVASGRPCFPQESNVRAKIGILVKSGDHVVRARTMDRVKAGDLIRIYVHPEASSYVYVVHTDRKRATMLNMVEQKIHSSTLVLPSLQEFYQVDGNSKVESFTVICSSEEVKEVSSLLTSQMDHEKWMSLQKDLVKKGEIDLGQQTERPFGIAGNVRGTADAGGDPFVKELQIFSGKKILVKQYEFSVKKQ
ncbi:MAG: hypothetical protein PHS17_03035 [Desulfobacterales bacterium]|nr:hypothetical protein [Desulfobacterales bacterium]